MAKTTKTTTETRTFTDGEEWEAPNGMTFLVDLPMADAYVTLESVGDVWVSIEETEHGWAICGDYLDGDIVPTLDEALKLALTRD